MKKAMGREFVAKLGFNALRSAAFGSADIAKKMPRLLAAGSFILALACATGFAASEKGRYAIVLQSGNETNEGKVRAAHALLYAEELAENGYAVALIFDGAGTGWAKVFQNPEHPLHKRYLRIHELGVVERICDHCAEANGVKEQLSVRQKNLLVSEYRGHQSLVKWIDRGYKVIVL